VTANVRGDKPQSVADITELYRFIEAGLSPLAASRRRALEELKDAAIRSLPSAAVGTEAARQALVVGADELLQVAEMEERNEAIRHGKRGKAWDGAFVRKMKLEAMGKVRAALADSFTTNAAPQAPCTARRQPEAPGESPSASTAATTQSIESGPPAKSTEGNHRLPAQPAAPAPGTPSHAAESKGFVLAVEDVSGPMPGYMRVYGPQYATREQAMQDAKLPMARGQKCEVWEVFGPGRTVSAIAATNGVTLPAACPFDARQSLEGKTGVDFIAGWDAMIEKLRRAASSPSTAAITVPAEVASGYEATIMQLEKDLECAREALIETQQELNRLRHGPAQYTNAGFCALLRRRGEEDAAREIERLERELARRMSSAIEAPGAPAIKGR
jgi:hypothetical protein